MFVDFGVTCFANTIGTNVAELQLRSNVEDIMY